MFLYAIKRFEIALKGLNFCYIVFVTIVYALFTHEYDKGLHMFNDINLNDPNNNVDTLVEFVNHNVKCLKT